LAIIGVEETDNKTLVYVKGGEKCEWLADTRDDTTIETLDSDYEDIDSLCNLDVTDTVENMLRIVRYRMYVKYTTDNRNVRKKYIKFKK